MPATGINVAPEVVPLIPGNADHWRLLLIAERFGPHEREAFFAFAHYFTAFMREQAPFGDDDIAPRIQVYACFTPSPPKGMFKTREHATRRIYGEPERVRKYLRKHHDDQPVLRRRKNDLALVIMNIAQRGGAGEQMNDNIAWTTPVPFFDDNRQMLEDWPQVALHELGHAFDLDDEYEAAGVERDVPPAANVCRDSEIDDPPWASRFAGADIAMLRSAERRLDGGNPDYPTPFELERFAAIEFGKFQGARYSSTQFWRSALQCRMRSTRDPFCGQCRAVIREAILSNA